MIKLFAIFLSVSIFFLSASKTFILLNYSLNKEYITKNLCENRSKPKMNCNGKCHLKKELQKDDKRDNSPSGGMKEKMEVQLFNSNCSVSSPVLPFVKTNYSISANQNYSRLDHSSVFHPPQA